MSYGNIVLFYPKLGWMDVFVIDLPLSIIYVSHQCRVSGIEIRYVDQRVEGDNWETALLEAVDDKTVLIGFSCMSGAPILQSLEATRYIKKHYPSLPTVWGGQHATICPKETLKEQSIDYIIRGHGSMSLNKLCNYISNGAYELSSVEGLGWRENGGIQLNPMSDDLDFPALDELDFTGIDINRYTRFQYSKNVYSLFTSFGCPHKCKFCFAPIFYGNIKGKKWFAYSVDEVVGHLENMVRDYNIGYISILDEMFFLDKNRAREILLGVIERGLELEWGIRGVRIDDLDRMDNDFFELMSNAGIRQLMIGAESGSERMLKIMKKGITVKQTIRVNKRLKDFPKLIPSYNFLSGIPGEHIDDMYKSVSLILTLLEDNPHANFSGMNQFVPFPGSELYDICVQNGFHEPQSLEEWSFVDTHYYRGNVLWLDKKFLRILHSIQSSLMFIDNKTSRELSSCEGDSRDWRKSAKRPFIIRMMFKLIVLLGSFLRIVAKFRLKNKFFIFPFEYYLAIIGTSIMDKLQVLRKKP